MLRVKIDRETVVKAVEYHAQENKGLDPVIEGDRDLADWLEYVLRDVGGLGDGTAESDPPIIVEVRDGAFIVGGSVEVMDTVRQYVL